MRKKLTKADFNQINRLMKRPYDETDKRAISKHLENKKKNGKA